MLLSAGNGPCGPEEWVGGSVAVAAGLDARPYDSLEHALRAAGEIAGGDGIGRGVFDKGVNLLGSWWQADEIKIKTPDESGLIGIGHWGQSGSFKFRQREGIDRALWPVFVFDFRNRCNLRSLKGPITRSWFCFFRMRGEHKTRGEEQLVNRPNKKIPDRARDAISLFGEINVDSRGHW